MIPQIKFENNTNESFQRWQEVALPYKADYPAIMKAGSLPLIKLRDVGTHSTLFACRPTVPAGGSVHYTVDETPVDETKIGGMVFHPTITDDLSELLPEISCMEGAKGIEMPLVSLDRVESNKARAVFKSRHSNGTYHIDTWYTIWTLEPWVRIQSQIIPCDHSGGAFTYPLTSVHWKFGEPVDSDIAAAEGFDIAGDNNNVLSFYFNESKKASYGEAIRFDGWLIGTPKGLESLVTPDPNDYFSQSVYQYTEEDVSILNSLPEVGPLHGLCTNWEGFLAYDAIPEIASTFTPPAHEELEVMLRDATSMYDRRQYASEIVAHQAGSQNSFGCTKGYQLLVDKECRFIRTLAYCAADEALRPVHLRTAEGELLKFTDHPEHRTWHRSTFSSSKDFLGKSSAAPYRTAAGRFGHLESHIASYLHCYIAVTGDYQAENWLEAICNRDLAGIRHFAGWIGESRAMGRQLQALANHYLLLPQYRQEIEAVLQARLNIIMENWPGKDVLERFPDRKILTLRHFKYLPDDNGVKQECASPWEEGRGACGAYAVYKVLENTNPQLAAEYRGIALLLSRTVIQWYFKDDTDKWRCPYLVYYRTGDDEGLVCEKGLDTWQMHVGGSDWVNWTLGAVKVYSRLQDNTQDEDRILADQIISEVPRPSNWLNSEWRAV